MLALFEELFLLALDEEKGKVIPQAKKTIAYGLAGDLLAELALNGVVCSNDQRRLVWQASRENQAGELSGDPILGELIQEIRSQDEPKKLTYWISHLAENPKKLRYRVGEWLVEKEILQEKDRRVFRRSPASTGDQVEVPSKFHMKRSLRGMILATETPDDRSLALLKLIAASDLLEIIFTLDELTFAKRTIYQKVVREALNDPAMQTVEEISHAISSIIEEEEDD